MKQMKMSLSRVCFFSALLFTTAAGCSKEVYYDYEGPQITLFKVVTEQPGKNCSRGGQRLSLGNDVNGNGILDDAEVTSVEYICNGLLGREAIANVVEDPGTPACTYGGQRLEIGIDENRDGTLTGSEIQATYFVCHDARQNDWSQVEELASVGDFTCARLKSAGVACWGRSPDGKDSSSTPVVIDGLSKAVSISAGCAISPQGYIECWQGMDSSPRRVSNIQDAIAVSGNPARHACAIFGEKKGVKCWGKNAKGQLGNGTTDDSVLPVEVFDTQGNRLVDVRSIAVGNEHSCAIVSDRDEVWCWGSNELGQLGANSDDYLSVGAVRVVDAEGAAISGAVSVAAGSAHTCASLDNKGVRCWGSNSLGQVGSSISTEAIAPYAVPVLDGRQELNDTASVSLGLGFSCTRLKSGTARCWGDNTLGQLGSRTQGVTSSLPVTVTRSSDNSNLTLIQSIAAGDDHVCAVIKLQNSSSAVPGTAAGSAKTTEVKCWGRSSGGQMGNSVTQHFEQIALSPVAVEALGGMDLRLGANHGCRKNADNSVSCWGLNEGGQLGSAYGTRWLFTDQPQQVLAADAQTDASASGTSETSFLTGVQEIVAGPQAHHTCAVRVDGSMVCWGRNGSGQLGDGSKTYWKPPVKVFASEGTILSSVGSAAVGNAHTCARLADNSIKCWGSNSNGQLGAGSSVGAEGSITPVKVSGTDSYTAVSAGQNFTCGLLQSKSAKCWGDGADGQLGNGTTNSSSAPVAVSSLTGIDSLKVGGKHACAVKGGSLWCWGNNDYGQLGMGNQTKSSVPVRISKYGGKTATVAVSDFCLGYYHTCASLADGTLWCWGNNVYGQAGNGTQISSTEPIRVNGLTDVVSLSCGMAHTCARLSNGDARCWGRNDYAQIGRSAGQMGAVDGAVMP